MNRSKPILLAGLLAMPAGCAGTAGPLATTETYTWASTRNMTTAELAARLLPPEEAAAAERHGFYDKIWPDQPLSGVMFYSQPEVVDDEACSRRSQAVRFVPAGKHRDPLQAGDVPVRFEEIHRYTEYSLSPGCTRLPGRRFADWISYQRPEIEALDILKTLAEAQRAARGPDQLPFRLTCDWHRPARPGDCATDLRALLATLPLHQATTIERNPFPNNCDSSSRDVGDAVEIGDRNEGVVWDVRLRRMGTPDAEIALLRQFPRTMVKC